MFRRIVELSSIYSVDIILFDPFNASSLVNQLDRAGFETLPFFQRPKYMSPAAKELKRLVINRNLNHLGNPILRWMAEHTDSVEDRNGNIRLVVSERRKKIDGIIALAMCIGWSVASSEDEESDYEQNRQMEEV